jgi:hypothetical protein
MPVLPACKWWKLWIDIAGNDPQFSEATLFFVDDYKQVFSYKNNLQGVVAVLSSPLLRAVFPSSVEAGAALDARVAFLKKNKIDDSLANVKGWTLGGATLLTMLLATFLSLDADVSFVDSTSDAGAMLHYKHPNNDGTCNEFVLMEFLETSRLTPADQWAAQFKNGGAFAGRAQNLWAIAAFAFWDTTTNLYQFKLPEGGASSLLWPDVYDPAQELRIALLVKQASAVITY